MRKALVVIAVVAFAAFAGNATAATKQLWYDPQVDAVASNVAGVSVRVDGEDDWNEWATYVAPNDPTTVLGFTDPFAPSTSVLYHRIFINPSLWPLLVDAAVNGPKLSQANLFQSAVAIFTMTHEAFHIRLMSGDENRVNACALQALPGVLTNAFGIPAADPQTVTTPVQKTVRVKYRVRVHRRWVMRYRTKVVTTYETTTTTVPDPTYSALLADAQDFYTNDQPPSYNTGTCT